MIATLEKEEYWELDTLSCLGEGEQFRQEKTSFKKEKPTGNMINIKAHGLLWFLKPSLRLYESLERNPHGNFIYTSSLEERKL